MIFKKYESFISVIIGALISLVVWIFTPFKLVPVLYPIVFAIISLLLFWFIFIEKCNHKKELNNIKVIPKIKIVRFENDDLLLTSNIQNFLTPNAYLTVFYMDNDFQRLYGVAQITNIQEANIIQELNIIQAHIIRKATPNIHCNKNDLLVKPILSKECLLLLTQN